jgi:uncharacterized protein (PEP-CTERM system associated)
MLHRVNTAAMVATAMDMGSKIFYLIRMILNKKTSPKLINLSNIKIYLVVISIIFTNITKADEKISQVVFNPSFDGSINLVPSISLTETWTNNVNLENSSRNSGWISELSPGIVVNGVSKRVKFNVNYSLHKFINKNSESGSSLQNSLSSFLFLEAIEKNLFFEADANISQRTISAFGKQVVVSDLNNSNKSDVSSIGLTPHVKGNFSNYINYEGRYSIHSIRSKDVSEINSNQSLLLLKLSGDLLFDRFRWSASAQEQIINNEITSDVQTDNFGLTGTYLFTNNLNFYGTLGREIGNYSYSGRSGYSTSGGGVSWTASETTKFSADMNKHQLGNMHKLSFEHRTSRTSWNFRDSKSIASSSNRNSADGFGSNYYLIYNLFSTKEPDPIKLDKLVREYMTTNGISMHSASLNGYLTSGTSVQRTQDLSFALLGLRDTITFSASKNAGTNVNTTPSGTDDFSKSSAIQQNGLGVIYSHKTTPDSVVSTQFSIQKTKADFDSQNSLMKMFNISYSSRLASKIFATMTLRHVIYSANTSSYKENAIVGKLMVQF